MDNELMMRGILAIYIAMNALRLLAYLPQIAAVARDPHGAAAISMPTWIFWACSHASTAVYCMLIAGDALLAGMMWGSCAGASAIAALTILKRRGACLVAAA
jgi:hypothetical protein